MIPGKTYTITLNTGVVEAVFIRFTKGGWLDCVVNGDPVCFSPDTIISFKEV